MERGESGHPPRIHPRFFETKHACSKMPPSRFEPAPPEDPSAPIPTPAPTPDTNAPLEPIGTAESPHFVNVARVGAIASGRGDTFEVAGKLVAVFHVDGQYFAIDDLCPHMGASLGAGELQNGVVSCPWHAWRFCVREGTWRDNPKLKIDRFETRVEGEWIQVRAAPIPRTG